MRRSASTAARRPREARENLTGAWGRASVGRMKPQPWLVIAPPVVHAMADGTYRAWTTRFRDLVGTGASPEAAAFMLRLLVGKRLYGRAWTWSDTPAALADAA